MLTRQRRGRKWRVGSAPLSGQGGAGGGPARKRKLRMAMPSERSRRPSSFESAASWQSRAGGLWRKRKPSTETASLRSTRESALASPRRKSHGGPRSLPETREAGPEGKR
jgi:hypothetical protein